MAMCAAATAATVSAAGGVPTVCGASTAGGLRTTASLCVSM